MSHPVTHDRKEPGLTCDEEWLLLQDDDYRSGLFRIAMSGDRRLPLLPSLSVREIAGKIWSAFAHIPRTAMHAWRENKERRVKRERLLQGVHYDRVSKEVTLRPQGH